VGPTWKDAGLIYYNDPNNINITETSLVLNNGNSFIAFKDDNMINNGNVCLVSFKKTSADPYYGYNFDTIKSLTGMTTVKFGVSSAVGFNTPLNKLMKYVSFITDSKLQVFEFNDSNVKVELSSIFSASSGVVRYYDNMPWVAYIDNTNNVYVRGYSSAWIPPSGQTIEISEKSNSSNVIDLAFSGTSPIVAFRDESTNGILVKKFGPTMWESIDSPIPFTNATGATNKISLYADNSKIFVAGIYGTGPSDESIKICTSSFTNPNWSSFSVVTAPANVEKGITNLILKYDATNTTLYIAYSCGGSENKIYIKKFKIGTDSSWSYIKNGVNNFVADNATAMSFDLEFLNGKTIPYISYRSTKTGEDGWGYVKRFE